MTAAARPLTVLHLTSGSDAGGISRYVRDMGDALTARGHRVLAAGRRGAWHELFMQASWPWIDVPLHGCATQLTLSGRTLQRQIEQAGGVDLIHAHCRRAALVGRRLAKRFNVPLLVSVHLTPIPLGVRRWLSDFGDHTLVASSLSRQWVIERARVPAQRVTCIEHGIDPRRFPQADEQARLAARAALGLPRDMAIAAYVGRLDRPKNEDWMLDVAAACRRNAMPAHVLIMGGGPHEKALRRAIQRRRLTGAVTMLPYGDPLPAYQAADLLLLPSRREGFALVCAEAMSVGTPVLRTDTAGAAEQIIAGQTGWATPVDREAFVGAAVRLLGDRATLASVGLAAAEHVRRHLSFTRQADRTEALYRQLAQPQR